MNGEQTIVLVPEQQIFLETYRQEMGEELREILTWWSHYARDENNGGYFGKVDNQNQPDIAAAKGLVLHARILWSYSAAALLTGETAWKQEADLAYAYLISAFTDTIHGGMYWAIHPDSSVADDKKQVYGQAFAIYGLVEYFKLTHDRQALDKAIELFRLLEKHSYDSTHGGYTEAFSRAWGEADDLRLSEKELNVSKTMNTHLHVIEAYASLYTVWKDALLQKRLEELLDIFYKHIIRKEKLQQQLFFSGDWEALPSVISFGHDIEAAWLLQECAEALDNEQWRMVYKVYAEKMANEVLTAIDNDGGLWYEYDPQAQHWIREKHWWPQAEAMVGFMNAWQVSGEPTYLDRSWQTWEFVKRNLKVPAYGEWYWGVQADNKPMPGEDKAGFWKCPYHNGRACVEITKRINRILSQ